MEFDPATRRKLRRRHPDYDVRAFEFVFEVLDYTQRMLGRVPDDEGLADDAAASMQDSDAGESAEEVADQDAAENAEEIAGPAGEEDPEERRSRHVTGRELLDGFRRCARDNFGLLARPVLERWGVRSTDDVGRLVFLLVEEGYMGKTEEDSLEDFVGVYEFPEVFDRLPERLPFEPGPLPPVRKAGEGDDGDGDGNGPDDGDDSGGIAYA